LIINPAGIKNCSLYLWLNKSRRPCCVIGWPWQRDKNSMAEESKQNSPQMNPPPQLLRTCPWTVHPLEGGLAYAIALGALALMKISG